MQGFIYLYFIRILFYVINIISIDKVKPIILQEKKRND